MTAPLDEDGTPWPLEFTCRLGWPAFNIELALHKNDPVAFLVGLASDASAPKQRQLDAVAAGFLMPCPVCGGYPPPCRFGRSGCEPIG
jgi:phosphoribosylamine---glycine ligase